VSTLEEQLDYALAHLRGARVETLPDGMRALRWTVPMNAPWTPDMLELLVVVPPTYPAQAPSGFDVRGAASVNGAVPAGAGGREVLGVMHQHYCWNPSGAIPYADLDGIWRFAQFSERRFALAS
jgi:hypothetical protein